MSFSVSASNFQHHLVMPAVFPLRILAFLCLHLSNPYAEGGVAYLAMHLSLASMNSRIFETALEQLRIPRLVQRRQGGTR